jgi:hypothetical protein
MCRATAWPTWNTLEILQRRAKLHSGIVDQYVNWAEMCFDVGDACCGSRRVGNVEYGAARFVALGGESIGGIADLRGVAAVQNDFGAVPRQPLRQRQAYALAGSRDQRSRACQIEKRFAQEGLLNQLKKQAIRSPNPS